MGKHCWTEEYRIELSHLMHLARTAVPKVRKSRARPFPGTLSHERKLWASSEFHKAHPEVSGTAAYKELCRQEAWRYL